MAITLRGTSIAGSSSATTRTLTVPSGHAAGDVGYVSVAYNSLTGTITPPAGWVTLWDQAASFGVRGACYRRVMDGTEVSWTWTFSAAASSHLALASFIGVHNTNPEDAPAGVADASASTAARSTFLAGGVKSVASNALMLCMFPTAGINSITATFESTMTTIVNTPITNFACNSIAYEQLSVAGPTGARLVITSKGGYAVAKMVALRPATYTAPGNFSVRKVRVSGSWQTITRKVRIGGVWQSI